VPGIILGNKPCSYLREELSKQREEQGFEQKFAWHKGGTEKQTVDQRRVRKEENGGGKG
jgi:hypothetical protein